MQKNWEEVPILFDELYEKLHSEKTFIDELL